MSMAATRRVNTTKFDMTAGETVQQINVPGEVALPEVAVESRREGHNPTPSPAPSENSGDTDFFEVGRQSETETVDASLKLSWWKHFGPRPCGG